MKLYAHQEKILDLNPKKYGIFSGTGTGKTITALALAKKNDVDVLIVCPKQVRRKWHEALIGMGVEGQVIGRDRFRIDHKKIKPYKAIIWDEAHVGIGNMKSQMWKALMGYIKVHKLEYVWLLTGTPYSREPMNIYSLAKALGYEWDFLPFRNRFYQPRYLGQRMIWEPKKGIEDDMAELIKKIGDTTRLEECFDVPDQVIEVDYFDETEDQKKAKKSVMENESDPMVRIIKNHQIASGTLKGNEFTETEYYDADKNQQILRYAEENKKMIVFSRYNAHLDLLKDMLVAEKIPCAVINGSVDDKESVFDTAEKSDRFVLLINAMICEGYELPSFNLMVFACLSYSYVHYVQSMYRILRSNALKKNVYKILLTKDTVDEQVYASVQRKEDFSVAIYAQKAII